MDGMVCEALACALTRILGGNEDGTDAFITNWSNILVKTSRKDYLREVPAGDVGSLERVGPMRTTVLFSSTDVAVARKLADMTEYIHLDLHDEATAAVAWTGLRARLFLTPKYQRYQLEATYYVLRRTHGRS